MHAVLIEKCNKKFPFCKTHFLKKGINVLMFVAHDLVNPLWPLPLLLFLFRSGLFECTFTGYAVYTILLDFYLSLCVKTLFMFCLCP